MPCAWEAPDGSRTVILESAVVEGVRACALEAFLSVPRRGAETGGLLLGRVDPADPKRLRVEAFEEIPCEHRHGPSYVLSDPDRAHLRQALARPAGSPAVVGFFRSYTGREPALDAADENLICTYLRNERHAYLLVKPVASDECEATFLFWQNGELPAGPCYPRFALDPAKMAAAVVVEKPLAAAEPEPPAAEQAPPAEPLAMKPAPAAGPEPKPEPEAEPKPEPIPVPAFAMPEPKPKPEAEPEPEPIPVPAFAMPEPHRRHAAGDDEDGGESGRPAPRKPRRGIWLPLLALILASVGAALVYEVWKIGSRPRWTEVWLDAHAAEGRVQLAWDPNAPAAMLASRGVLSVTDGALREEIQLSPAQIRAGSYGYKPSNPDLMFHLELYDGVFPSGGGALRLMTVPAASTPPLEAKTEAPQAEVPPDPAPAVEPPKPEVPPKPVREGIAERGAGTAVAVPPAVLHEVHPGIPAGIRSRIHGHLVVSVEVHVAGNGKVTHASAARSGDTVYRYVADRAVSAAYSWRFRPARSRGGRPVAAKKTIYFVFTQF